MGGRPSRSISSAPTSAGFAEDKSGEYEILLDFKHHGLPHPLSLRMPSRVFRVGKAVLEANSLMSRLSVRVGEISGFEFGHEAIDFVLCDLNRPFPTDLIPSGSVLKLVLIKTLPPSSPRSPHPLGPNLLLAQPPTHTSLADFCLMRCIGEGASCVVALARSQIDGKLYALKLLGKERILASKPKRLDRAKQERDVLLKFSRSVLFHSVARVISNSCVSSPRVSTVPRMIAVLPNVLRQGSEV